jgi:hypothetical protein
MRFQHAGWSLVCAARPAHSPLVDRFRSNREALMSDARMAELYERLVASKSKQATPERIFLRGCNAGLDIAIKHLKIVCEETDEMTHPTEEAAET